MTVAEPDDAKKTDPSKRSLPDGWQWVQLGNVCSINPRRIARLNRHDDAPTTFVGMAAVDEQEGVIARPEVRSYREVRKGYTYFTEGDVLFAKITPCMQNGKHAIARGLIDGIGFGSTEFHILHPSPQVTAAWIHYFVRQPSVLLSAIAHFTGTVGQQRVPEDFLEALEIPLPSVREQQRITTLLTEQMAAVERARSAAEAQLEAARELPAAYLHAVFDISDAQQWIKKPVGEVGAITSGITLGRKLRDVETQSVPYLRVANVKDGYLDLSDVYRIEATTAEINKCRLQFGDLLLTEGGDPDKLGRGTFWEEQIPDCIHQNHIFRVRFDLDEFSPHFIAAQLGSPYGKAYFLAHAKQTTGIATINQQVLARFPLMVPTLPEQQSIAAMLAEQLTTAKRIRTALEGQLTMIEKLPATLLRQAFNGEL